MKLTKKQKELILQWGYKEKEFNQIERASECTRYTVVNRKEEYDITREEVIKLLGEREFLSGLCRSAFHWSACRCVNGHQIIFDSSRLFR